MNYQELEKLDQASLKKNLTDLQEKLQNLRMKSKLGQVKNVHELAATRKDIARILTYIRTK